MKQSKEDDEHGRNLWVLCADVDKPPAEINIETNSCHVLREVILLTPYSIYCSAIDCVSLMLCVCNPYMRTFRSISNLIFQVFAFMGTEVVLDVLSSTYEMDNSAPQSQSSLSMSNPNLDSHSHSHSNSNSNSTSGTNPPEFRNRGLLLWNQTRQQWIGDKGSSGQQRKKKGKEPAISWNATYDNLLGTNKPFPKAIPLPEMVNFLVDVWEEEGLYD
ncbi:unnamed protein product [Lactuca saligna]|uniref:Gag1-like clamp domain-containing protein n=1 Tax=Lactuca saligna TaxID=75948 RepID=A0AA35YCY2_LACSI|nr:unnamed protein product [Lactuca saligna]